MSIMDNNYDFLKEITLNNISKAKANFQFRFNKYKTLYVVDTYDIIEFCFPLIFNSGASVNPQLNISNFLSYQFFFFNNETRPIIFDEYKSELFSFWYRLRRSVSEYSNYDGLKNSMLQKYNELTSNRDKIIFIESNIGMLLAIAFGALSRYPVDRYNSLVTQCFQIDSLEIENKSDKIILEDIFVETTPNLADVNRVFDKFCEEVRFSMARKSEEDRLVYLENSYRDIKVFDRIVNINRKLNSEEVRKKLKYSYNVQYLSSAPIKSDLIEKYYKEDLPLFKGAMSTSVHRNNIEYYLYQLLNIGDSEEQRTMIVDFLERLEKVCVTYGNNSERIKKFKDIFYENESRLNLKLLERTSDIDDIFLKYHSINDHRAKIRQAIEVLKTRNDEVELLVQFGNILDAAEKKQKALMQLDESFDLYDRSINIKSNIVLNIDFLNKNFSGSRNKNEVTADTVKSLIQSLPVLLFCKKGNIKEVQKLFREIVKPEPERNRHKLSTLINTPQSLLYDFSTWEKNIFFLFVRYVFDSEMTGEAVIKELDYYLELSKKQHAVIYNISKDKIDVVYSDSQSFRNDLLYFQTWVLRRTNMYDRAISVIDDEERATGIDQSQVLDTRLNHSRALCFKNKFYREFLIQSSGVLTEYLLNANKDLLVCEEGYKSLKQAGNSQELIDDVLRAVSNSVIDTYTKLYMLDNKAYEAYIPGCRIRLDLIKKQMTAAGQDYSFYLAFGHTEIDLEFCESLVALSKGDIQVAQNKIQNANQRLEKIRTSPSFKTYDAFERSSENIKRVAKVLLKDTKGDHL